MVMTLTILGSGTSHGVPVIGCRCKVCTSENSKNNRLRCSAFLKAGDKNYLIDAGPDFRQQALRENICSLDGVFLTHSHADHIHGIDDLRIFSHKNSNAMNQDKELVEKYPETAGDGLPVFTGNNTIAHIRDCFKYLFVDHDKGGGIPKLNFIAADDYSFDRPVVLDELKVVPVPMLHGNHHTKGWVFTACENGQEHSIAYLTDCSFISEESLEIIRKSCGILDHLVIDALRQNHHSSHNNFDQALEYADRIGARHTWFTHLTHDMLHEEVQHYIDENLSSYQRLFEIVKNNGSVSPAFDGLRLSTY